MIDSTPPRAWTCVGGGLAVGRGAAAANRRLARLDAPFGDGSRDPEVSRFGDAVPPLFWFRDPEGNTLMFVEAR